MKICIKCNTEKQITSFCAMKASKDGLQSWCNQCMKAVKLAWSKKNKDKLNAYCVTYRAANPEKKKLSNAAYRAANGEKIKDASRAASKTNAEKLKAVSAAWYAANSGKAKARHAAYYAANPEKYRIHRHNRRACVANAGGKLSNGLSAKLFKLQKGKCPCCKQPLGDNYHMDHIMPIKLGGSNTDDNIQLLRQRCNNQKHAKHPIDFMRSRGFLL